MGRRSILLIGISLAVMAPPLYADGNTTVQSSIVSTQPYITQGVEVQRGSTWYLGTHKDHHMLRAILNYAGVKYEQLKKIVHDTPRPAPANPAMKALLAQATKLNQQLTDIHRHDVKLKKQIMHISRQLPPLPNATCHTFYYRVLNGDSLGLIAKHVLKHPRDWKIIYNANKARIGRNPNSVDIGMVLKIPAKAN